MRMESVLSLTQRPRLTLKLTVTMTDKTAFTRPMVSTVIYKLHENPAWEPKEFLCTPQTDYHADAFVR